MSSKTLPEGWEGTTLGEIRFDLHKGIVPSKFPTQKFEMYSVPSFEIGKPEIITGQEIGSNKQIVKEDTVLLCKINPRINRVWIVSNYSPLEKIASTEWIPFFKVSGIEPKYLCYFLQNPIFREFLSVNVSGVGGSLMRTKPGLLANFPFPLPPLPEQHAIVAKLEELFSDLDDGVASLKQAQAQLTTYRQAVLQYAFEGKLTAAWREARRPAPAAALLEQVQADRAAQHQRQLAAWQQACEQANAAGAKKPPKPQAPKTLPPLSAAELADLPELPEGWGWMKLGNIAESCLGKMLDAEKNKGILRPYLRNTNIRWGYFDLSDLQEMKFEDNEEERYGIKKGDLVVCEGGEPGRAAIWNEQIPNMKIQKALHRVRFEECILNKYVLYFLMLSSKNGYLEKYFTGTTIKHLPGERLKSFTIALCSLEEQHQIVQEIEARLSVCDQLEQTIAASLRTAASLRQSLLKHAFEGRLTAGWRAQHPDLISGAHSAAALLEQIQQERAQKGVSDV